MRTVKPPYFFAFLLLLSVYGCGLNSFGFQSGKTLGRGVTEATPHVGQVRGDGVRSGMAMGFNLRTGVGERVDIGFNASLFPHAFVKVQVVGDRYSPVAMSIGAGGGFSGSRSAGGDAAFYLAVPLVLSVHEGPTSFYLSGNYLPIYTKRDREQAMIVSGGLELDTRGRVAFGLNFSYLFMLKGDFYPNLSSLGVGVKFKL